eukprot:8411564-Karenia_brevis.AAC.1
MPSFNGNYNRAGNAELPLLGLQALKVLPSNAIKIPITLINSFKMGQGDNRKVPITMVHRVGK